MGKKKGKRQDDDLADQFKQDDQSTAYVSKQKLAEMEAKEATLHDFEDEAPKKSKKSKKNKKGDAEEDKQEEDFGASNVVNNFDVDLDQDGATGDFEDNFKGMAKKNTRKKKNTEGNLNKEVDLANAFAAEDSDEDAPKKKKGKKHDKKKGKKQQDSEEEEEKKEEDEEEAEDEAPKVVYCGKCTLPPEYCSFGQKDITACKEWLQKNYPDLFVEVYGEPEEKEDGEVAEGEEKKEEEKKAEPPKKKKVKFGGSEGLVKVYRLKRGGRKITCQITGFEHYTKDLKALAQKFGKKFSCGSGVAQDDIYGECISVQGDVEDRLLEMLETDKDLQKLEVPANKVVFEDCGNKKGRKQK
mmetsp:Transcript_29580/g.45097  ORF Transcript_29580/g.45097 Transcript_29580/m.45097 type:complete len:355 (-) Transcript_29580:7-1071(-)